MLSQLFAYGQTIVPHHLFSRLMGKVAYAKTPWLKNFCIRQFMRQYGVSLEEAEFSDYQMYQSFNAFFTRALKPDARKICHEPKAIISPVDGTLCEFGKLKSDKLLQAKGKLFSLAALLGVEPKQAEDYIDGEYAILYLSPKDYHRVHMPMDGTLIKMRYVPGRLFSVNKTTCGKVNNLFCRNERVILHFTHENKPFVVILVGAMIVASIHTTWAGTITPRQRTITEFNYENNSEKHFKKGDLLGHFNLGSTVILLTPQNTLTWDKTLMLDQSIQFGQAIAQKIT